MGHCSLENDGDDLHLVFYIMLFIYFIYFFYDLFFPDSRSLWSLFAISLIAVPFLFERYSGMYFPWKIKIVIILSLLLHTIGEVHRWYYDLPNYDKISHFLSSVAIGYLVFLFIILTSLYYGLRWRRAKIAFFILFVTTAFAFFWEWWELFSDAYFGSKFFWNMQDGFGDAIVNFCGAVFVAWDADSYLKDRSWSQVAGDFIRPGANGDYKMKWEVLPMPEYLEGPEATEGLCWLSNQEANLSASPSGESISSAGNE